MTKEELSEQIFNRYGIVTRAKGSFLYTKKGVRLTDMFLEDGRAILGWQGGSAFTHLKNNLSKGILGSFRTQEVSRLEKACSELFNSKRKLLCFYTKMDALKAALLYSKESTFFWKPFSKATDVSSVDCLVFMPPLPWTDSIYYLAVKEDLVNSVDIKTISNRQKLPSPVEAAVTRSIYDLILAQKEREEKDWFIYDTALTKYWTRIGCYLQPKVPMEKYDDFILYCLDNKIVINPDYFSGSIVPYGIDKGNFSSIKNSPFVF